MAVASARGELPAVMARLAEGLPPADDVDDGAAQMVAKERHAGPAAIHERWRQSCTDLRAALLDRQPGDRLLWMVGDLAARTLGTTRLAETWIHTGDVAAGLGVELEPADRLQHVARLAWRTIPYAFTKEGLEPPGPVAFELTAPSGAMWAYGDDDAPTVIRG